jgi:hypothetical protein
MLKSRWLLQIAGRMSLFGLLALGAPARPQSTNLLSGFGTASVDGVFALGEWDRAGTIDLAINLPEGGTTPGRIYVMSDRTNLYFAVRLERGFIDQAASAAFYFNNGDGGTSLAPGDDGIVFDVFCCTDQRFFDIFYYTNSSCPAFYLCSDEDVNAGGNTDGRGGFSNNGTCSFFELSHPLNSGDPHDISLATGQTIGCWPFVRLLNATNYADTFPDMVTILVAPPPPNHPPTARSQAVSVLENTSTPIVLSGSDPDSDPISYVILTGPTNGTLTGSAPTLNYQPNADYAGPDTFTFKVNDGQLDSEPALVSITVLRANHPPVSRIDLFPVMVWPGRTSVVAIASGGAKATMVLGGSSSNDPDGDALSYIWTEGPLTIGRTEFSTNVFGLGSHTVELTVSDGMGIGTGEAGFEVVAPNEPVVWLMDLVESSSLAGQTKRPLLATLRAARASFERGDLSSGTYELRAFQHQARALVGHSNPNLATGFVAAAGLIENAIIDEQMLAVAGASQTKAMPR